MRRFTQIALLTALLLAGGSSSPARAVPVQTVPDQILRGYQMIDEWRIAEAETLANELMKQYPDLGDTHFLMARVEFFKGNYEHAWKILKRVENDQGPVREFKALVSDTHKATSNLISRESEHFIFYFVPGPDEILIPYATKALETSYKVLGALLNYYPEKKVRVEIYPDRGPLSRISPLTRQDIITSGTVALCKYNRIMLISPGSLVRGYNWLDTLSHEYTHYLLTKKSRNNLPLWMHEGIAKHFESRWRNSREILSPVMETVLATGLEKNYLISLDSMMPSLAKLKTQEDVQLAYAEVATMVDYLIQAKGETVIPSLLEDLAQGKDFETALIEQAGMDLATFQENWKTYMKQKNLRSIPGLRAIHARFKTNRSVDEDKKDYREVGEKRSQDLTFLGDILKSRDQFQAAILEYEKAKKKSRIESPILYNKMAGTYMILKKYDEAEPLLKKTLQHYPDFHTTLTNLGELYFLTEHYEQSRNYFERAIQINPFNPFVHLRLIKLYDLLKMPEEKQLQARLYHYIE